MNTIDIDWLGELGLVPVVKVDRAGDGPPLFAALLKDGLPCAEFTHLTQEALAVIRGLRGSGGAV